jgi:hypothetical protein
LASSLKKSSIFDVVRPLPHRPIKPAVPNVEPLLTLNVANDNLRLLEDYYTKNLTMEQDRKFQSVPKTGNNKWKN